MNRKSARKITVPMVAGICLAMFFMACNKGDIAGTTTETIVSGKTTGLIFLADGKPASGASIKVLKVGYRPLQDSGASTSFRTITDKTGRYYIDSLASGDYNVLSELNGFSAYQDSVFLSGTARTLASDTLDDPGINCGYVALEPGDPVRTVTIQVLGTQAYANVDAKGFFTLPKLAPGVYRAAVSTTLPDYTTLYAPMEVMAGMKDTLADTLRPIYTGIPQVTALTATYDTLSGTVHLSWPPSEAFDLKDYAVFRDVPGALESSYFPLDLVEDTTFTDMIFQNPLESKSPRTTPQPFAVLQYEYRIAIRNQFREIGRTYGSKTVHAASPSHVVTYGTLRSIDYPENVTGLNHSVRISLQYENHSRKIQKIVWSAVGLDIPARTINPASGSGLDTLVFTSGSQPTSGTIYANLTDEGGMEWTMSLPFQVISNPPSVDLIGDVTVSRGQPITLSAPATKRFGEIVKWEWDIGATGTFTQGSGKDTTFLAPETPQFDFKSLVRVTDDEGLTAVDSLVSIVSTWKKGGGVSPPPIQAASVGFQGKPYLIGGWTTSSGVMTATKQCFAYDPLTDNWNETAPLLHSRIGGVAVATASKIFLLGGWGNPSNPSGSELKSIEEFDPVTNTWSFKSDAPILPYGFSAFVVEDKLYVIGGAYWTNNEKSKSIYTYDITLDSWSEKYVGPELFSEAWLDRDVQIASIESDAYVLYGGHTNGKTAHIYLQKLSPGTLAITSLPGFDVPASSNFSFHLCESQGWLFAIIETQDLDAKGQAWVHLNQVFIYKPELGKWEGFYPLLGTVTPRYFAMTEGKFFAIGGFSEDNQSYAPLHVEWANVK